MSELLLHPDTTREMPLLMVQQMRDGTRMQVLTTNPVHSDKGDSIAENDYMTTLDMEPKNTKYPFELSRPASSKTPSTMTIDA